MSGALSSIVWFLGPVSIQKMVGHLHFFLSSSNRNHGKPFVVLSKKNLDKIIWLTAGPTHKRYSLPENGDFMRGTIFPWECKARSQENNLFHKADVNPIAKTHFH